MSSASDSNNDTLQNASDLVVSLAGDNPPIRAGTSSLALGGTGLFSTRQLTRGSSLLKVPSSSTLSTSNVLELSGEVETTLGYLQEFKGWRLSERTVVCVALLRLLKLSESSEEPGKESDGLWKAYGKYLAALPKSFPGHPLTWLLAENESSNDLATLIASISPTLSTALTSKLGTLSREFDSSKDIFTDHLLLHCSSKQISLKDWIWADLAYHTRVIALGDAIESIQQSHLEEDTSEGWNDVTVMSDVDRYHLVPGLDFANHAKVEESNARWRPFRENATVGIELISTRNVESGEEITITYSTSSSIESNEHIIIAQQGAVDEELVFTHGIPPSKDSLGWQTASLQLIPPRLDAELPRATPGVLARLGVKGRGAIRLLGSVGVEKEKEGKEVLEKVVPDSKARLAVLIIHGCLVGDEADDGDVKLEISEEDGSELRVSVAGEQEEVFKIPEDAEGLLQLLSLRSEVVKRGLEGLRDLVAEDLGKLEEAMMRGEGWKGQGTPGLGLLKEIGERRVLVLRSVVERLDV